MLFSYNGKGFSVAHNPDTRFIRDVGKSGWIAPTMEIVAGGFQQSDMIVVNGKDVIFDVLLDNGPFELRIGMVGESIGTRVNVVVPTPNKETHAMYASHWALMNGDANPDSAGIVISQSVNLPVTYNMLAYERLANSVGGFNFTVASPALRWAIPPIGKATGAANVTKWFDTPGSKLESMVQNMPNVDLWGGSLGDEIPGGVETWGIVVTNTTPTPSALLRTLHGMSPAVSAVDLLQLRLNNVLWGLSGMALDSFVDRIKKLEYDDYSAEYRLAYFEYFGAVPDVAAYRTNLKIGGSLRAAEFQNRLCGPDINGGTIGWKQDRELAPPLPAQTNAFPYGEALPLTARILRAGTGGGPTFTVNNPVDLITRRVGFHITTPFAQDKIQVLVRKL